MNWILLPSAELRAVKLFFFLDVGIHILTVNVDQLRHWLVICLVRATLSGGCDYQSGYKTSYHSYLPDDSNMQFVEFSCIYLMYSLKILNIEINLPDIQFVDFKCRNLLNLQFVDLKCDNFESSCLTNSSFSATQT